MPAKPVADSRPASSGFKELFRFTKPYSRQRYWATWLLALLANVLLSFVVGLVAAAFPPAIVISIGLSLAIGWIMLAATIKRLRDADISLWWVLLNFVPLVNIVAIIVFGCIAPAATKNMRSAKNVLITTVSLMLVLMVLPTLIITYVGYQLINNTARDGLAPDMPAATYTVDGVSGTLPVEAGGDAPAAQVPQDAPAQP